MSDEIKKNIRNFTDDFWDLSSSIPIKRYTPAESKSTSTVSIDFSHSSNASVPSNDSSSTVIKRYINPLHEENKRIQKEAYDSIESYSPESSLIHLVKIKRKKSQYKVYNEFMTDLLKYKDAKASECEFVPFYSYVPQYNQMSSAQLSYYLWWRDNFKRGVYIRTEYSYVLLFVFELINSGKDQDVAEAQKNLAEIWNHYSEEYVTLQTKLAAWICDFSLLHRLPPPNNISRAVVKHTQALKEFYIHMPNGDFDRCVRSLLKYGTEYDYRTSKFAKGDNLRIFDKHIFGALKTAVECFSENGKPLSRLYSEDSKLIRSTYEGAICVSNEKYDLEIKYCSFSRSNELRFLMGDIVKYAENKIRAFLGVKSKLSVYSLSNEITIALDRYFETAFAQEERPTQKKKVEHHDYDILYDLPKQPLSLENAKRIENDSWNTTNDLISAFDADEEASFNDITKEIVEAEPIKEEISYIEDGNDLESQLGIYWNFALAVKALDGEKIEKEAQKLAMLPEAVVDIINEIAVEAIGDILIEEGDNGFEIIECYRELL